MVSDTDIPAAAIRNYLEQSLVRQVLGEVTKGDKFGAIADVGAGYGRLSCVLQEFSDNVFAIEREAELRRIGNSLNPNVVFLPVETLSNIPLVDASVGMAMTFTVLQHMPDDEARSVIAEMRRIVWHGGTVLLVEETDPDVKDVYGRPLAQYLGWTGFKLIKTWPRLVEPTYPRKQVGEAMLFWV
jgi:SAM-dependent methyltransferase